MTERRERPDLLEAKTLLACPTGRGIISESCLEYLERASRGPHVLLSSWPMPGIQWHVQFHT